MCRAAREKVGNSIYHICVRGNNKQAIFLDNEDREEYLMRVRRYEECYKMQICAYCLMTNHVHLLIYDNNQDISRFMQGLSLSYVIYFNKKYKRTGHLFQDRFNSTIIKSDMQFIYVSKYIHLNPVRANIVSRPIDYKWSSYSVYELGVDANNLVNSTFLLKYFSNKATKAQQLYSHYVNSSMDDITEDEIAIAQEGELSNPKMNGIDELSVEEVIKKLEQKWNEKIDKVLSKEGSNYRNKRMIVVYLVSLLARKTYKQVSQILHINLNETYQVIKKIVGKMIASEDFRKEVDRLIS